MAQDAERQPGDARLLQTRIAYDVELNGSVETKELPFVLGVLADLSGSPAEPLPPFEQRKFVQVDQDSFRLFMGSISPRLALQVENKLSCDGGNIAMELRFYTPEDFEPDGLVYQIDPLRKLVEARASLTALLAKTEGKVELRERLEEVINSPGLSLKAELKQSNTRYQTIADVKQLGSFRDARPAEQDSTSDEDLSLLDQIFRDYQSNGDEYQRDQSRDQIATLVEEAMQGSLVMSKNFETAINARIAEIDRLVSAQLNEILHTSEFQRLEGTWRGLHRLVHRSKTGPLLKIRVCNVSKRELLKDQETHAFPTSVLFKRVCEEEFGSFGGTPYCVLIGDYEFRNDPRGMALLKKIARVAAAAYAPFIAAASHELFEVKSFSELSRSHDLSRTFNATQYAKWRSFQESEEARYAGLVLPRVLMRLPYGPDTHPAETFRFIEDVDETDQSKFLWGNAVYSFGTCLTADFANDRWCGGLVGPEGGGLVPCLPLYYHETDHGQVESKCPTEIAITDRLENELSKLGFIPLVHCKETDYAAFFSMQSCHKLRMRISSFDVPEADVHLSTQLPFVFATARFVHYLNAIVRDRVGAFRNSEECEDYLNAWIAGYVLSNDSASSKEQAQRPLREAHIGVSEVPGRAKTFTATISLKPHFQLEGQECVTVVNLPSVGEKRFSK